MNHPHPHFAEALRAFGESSPEVARALGVSQRSAYNYIAGLALPHVKVVKRHPTIDAALTLDLAPAPVNTGTSLAETGEKSQQTAP